MKALRLRMVWAPILIAAATLASLSPRAASFHLSLPAINRAVKVSKHLLPNLIIDSIIVNNRNIIINSSRVWSFRRSVVTGRCWA